MGKGKHSPRAHLRVALAMSHRKQGVHPAVGGLGTFLRAVHTPQACRSRQQKPKPVVLSPPEPSKQRRRCGRSLVAQRAIAGPRRLRRFDSADFSLRTWELAKAAATAEEAKRGRKATARRAIEGRPELRRFDSADFSLRRATATKHQSSPRPRTVMSPAHPKYDKVWPAPSGQGSPRQGQTAHGPRSFYRKVLAYHSHRSDRTQPPGRRPVVAIAAARSALNAAQRAANASADATDERWFDLDRGCVVGTAGTDEEDDASTAAVAAAEYMYTHFSSDDDGDEQLSFEDADAAQYDEGPPLPSPPLTPILARHGTASSPSAALATVAADSAVAADAATSTAADAGRRGTWKRQSLVVVIPTPDPELGSNENDDVADDCADPADAKKLSPTESPAATASTAMWRRPGLAISIPPPPPRAAA